jgi:2-hydroxychromene-2-carboxylate isomerase
MQSVRFYFDFVSPYAYLAWTQIAALAARHDRELELVPTLFAGLLEANRQLGPAEIPRKRAYIYKDAVRSAHALGVEIKPPPSHPFNPLLGLRVCSADLAPAERTRAVDAMFRAVWAGGPGITDPATVTGLLAAAGLDGAALVAAAATDEIKQRVRAQTEQALAHGAFGVPTMIVDGELFWGVDSLPHVERRLHGDDPVDKVDLAGWLAIPVGSARRR